MASYVLQFNFVRMQKVAKMVHLRRSTYHLYSWLIGSTWPIDTHGIGCDEFCQLDNGPSGHPLLCMCKYDSDECFVWRIPSSHRNCKCRSACPNFCRRTLCREYPKDDHLKLEKQMDQNMHGLWKYIDGWILWVFIRRKFLNAENFQIEGLNSSFWLTEKLI